MLLIKDEFSVQTQMEQKLPKTVDDKYESLRKEYIENLQSEIDRLEKQIQTNQWEKCIIPTMNCNIHFKKIEDRQLSKFYTEGWSFSPVKSPLKRIIKRQKWEKFHSWLYRLFHKWKN